jgi:outer membrane protein TolC
MATEDLDQQLARDIADATLAHAAEQYATVAAQVRRGESTQTRLESARQRLQEAAQAWCQAHGHADAP